MKKRVFIAINLPDFIKKELEKIILILKKKNKRVNIKWVAPNNLHLTLHFLGYLEKDQLVKMGEGIEKITSRFSVMELGLDEVGGFPHLNKPRVIFIRLKEKQGQNLIRLVEELKKFLLNLGPSLDNRPWQPHITLGRVKDLNGSLDLKVGNLPLFTFFVRSIELMESELKREGPEYFIIKSFKLAPRNPS